MILTKAGKNGLFNGQQLDFAQYSQNFEQFHSKIKVFLKLMRKYKHVGDF